MANFAAEHRTLRKRCEFHAATKPGGAQKLAEAAKQETGTLGKFADMLGGGGQSNFIERGSQLLTSLLGAGGQSALVSAIGQFAGLGQGKSGSLLGMLAPVVMGTIAQQQSPRGGGLGGLLDKLQKGGLGDVANSWIGTGQNQPVTPKQLGPALGPDIIKTLAQRR
jgi:uncharacterized protein YidB (DUF937 family)